MNRIRLFITNLIVLASFAGAFALAEEPVTPAQIESFHAYQAGKAEAESKHGKDAGSAWKALAETDHANRLPYVKAWCHQNAAVSFMRARDQANAEAEATAALAIDSTGSTVFRQCHARAHSVLAYYLALKKDTLEAAREHYEKAIELDPSYETAKEGLHDVNKAIGDSK